MSFPLWFNRNDPVPDKHEAFVKDLLTKQRQHLGDAGAWEWLKQTALAFTEGDKNDAETLARYIVQDVYNIGGEPSPTPNPATGRTAYKPAGEQQFFDGHLCRAWDHPKVSDSTIVQYLNGAARNGFTGICIELCGHVPSFGGNVNAGGQAYKDAGGIISYHVKQVESARFAFLLAECRKRNLWLWVMDLNSNDKALKGIKSLSDVSRINSAMVGKFGTAGIMRTSVNEDDGNMDAKLREDYENVVAGSMPDNQTISSFERESWAVYTDIHPSKIDKIKSYPRGKTTFVTSDNGTCLDEMTTGSTLGGDGRADIPQHVRFATEAQKIGASWCNYAFMYTYQPELQDALGKVILRDGSVEPSPVPTNGDAIDISRLEILQNKHKVNLASIPVTKTLKKASMSNGHVDTSRGITGWGGSYGEGLARGHIYWLDGGKLVGGHFDWYGEGQTHKTLKNIPGGYLGRKPSAGARVYFCIVSNDAKQRTNLVDGGIWK